MAGTRLHAARRAGGRPNLGFATRLMVATTMPCSRTGSSEFVRHSGLYDLCLLAPRPFGLPYGRYPRLALTWIVTEAVRTRTPLLHPGRSLSAFAAKLGITPSTGTKGTLQQLRGQLQSLLHLTVLCRNAPSSSPFALPPSFGEGVRLFQPSPLWWDGPASSEPYSILLSQEFFDEILAHPVPIDLDAIRTFRSPLEMDAYMWLTYRSIRASRINRPETIPWEALQRQFGSGYSALRVFRFHFLRALKSVIQVYPAVRLRKSDRGLVLLPFPPHIEACGKKPGFREGTLTVLPRFSEGTRTPGGRSANAPPKDL